MIDTKTIIDNHQLCIEIMEGIASFQRYILNAQRNLEQYQEFRFRDMEENQKHQIDIYERCIVRLQLRYSKVLKEIK